MTPALRATITRLRELEAKAANGALPGVRREWRAEVDDHSTLFPGIYAEGYSVLVDERCEADYSDLRLIAEARNALVEILDALEEAERIAQLPREYLADLLWKTIVCPHCPEEGTCEHCAGAGVIVDGDRAERDEWSKSAEVLGLAPYGGCYAPEAVLPAVKRLKAERDDSIGKARRGRERASAEIARLTARVAELERELDDDVSPADQEALEAMVKRTMARYETRIEEQKRLAAAEARVTELEASITSVYNERDRALGASEREARRADEASSRISALEDTIDLERARRVLAPGSYSSAVETNGAVATIAEIESRRGVGWNGARE